VIYWNVPLIIILIETSNADNVTKCIKIMDRGIFKFSFSPISLLIIVRQMRDAVEQLADMRTIKISIIVVCLIRPEYDRKIRKNAEYTAKANNAWFIAR
jgi:hypothetical protein